jgi:cell shape-determining protein MreD
MIDGAGGGRCGAHRAESGSGMLVALVPGVSLLAAGLLVSLAWGSSGDGALLAPALLMAPVHFCSLRAPRHLPLWLVFATGLAADILTGGPLGFWPLLLLLSGMLGRLAALLSDRRGVAAATLMFVPAAAFALAVGWLAASLHELRPLPWSGFGWSLAAAVAAYPPSGLLLGCASAAAAGASRVRRMFGGAR